MTSSSPSDAGIRPEHNRNRLENGRTLDRVTFRATDEQLAAIESLVDAGVYRNRSEVIRASIQHLLEHHGRIDGDRERR